MVNKVFLIGRIGADARGDKERAYFTLATSEQNNKTLWHDITVFNSPVFQWLKKGKVVHIEGRIHYYGTEINKKTSITASKITLLSKPGKADDVDFDEAIDTIDFP